MKQNVVPTVENSQYGRTDTGENRSWPHNILVQKLRARAREGGVGQRPRVEEMRKDSGQGDLGLFIVIQFKYTEAHA